MLHLKLRTLWITAAVLSLLALLSQIQHWWTLNHFTCQGELVTTSSEYRYSGLIRFTFDNGEGRYDSVGSYVYNNEPSAPHDTTLLFKFWEKDNQYFMLSEEKNPEVISRGNELKLPDFFGYRGRGIMFEIKYINANTLLFSEDNTPVLLCRLVP